MAKSLEAASGRPAGTGAPAAPQVAHDPDTGRSVTVRGLGALKDSTLALRKDVDLLKPIAEQALGRRAGKKAGKHAAA